MAVRDKRTQEELLVIEQVLLALPVWERKPQLKLDNWQENTYKQEDPSAIPDERTVETIETNIHAVDGQQPQQGELATNRIRSRKDHQLEDNRGTREGVRWHVLPVVFVDICLS